MAHRQSSGWGGVLLPIADLLALGLLGRGGGASPAVTVVVVALAVSLSTALVGLLPRLRALPARAQHRYMALSVGVQVVACFVFVVIAVFYSLRSGCWDHCPAS